MGTLNPTVRSSLIAAILATTTTLAAHAQVVLGASAGAVHYDSQSTTSSFGLNPEVRYERPGFVLDVGGGYTSASDGYRAGDGGGTLWAATHPGASHYQVDGLLQAATTHPHLDSASSAVMALGEVAYAPHDRGVAAGVGVVQGSIAGTPSVSALRTEVRGWYAMPDQDVILTGSIEPTRLAGAWFTEVAGSAEWTPGDWDLTGALRLRAVSGSSALGGTASVSRDLTPRLAAELDAGRYLKDPYQGLPAGYFVSLGIRVKLATFKGGEAEGVKAAELGDVSVAAAARSFGFGRSGIKTTGRPTSSLPGAAGGTGTRGTGNGHRP